MEDVIKETVENGGEDVLLTGETAESAGGTSESSRVETEVEVVEESPVFYTELEALQHIDATLTHIDSVCEYGVSMLIVFMLILILNYIYKFFKLFF